MNVPHQDDTVKGGIRRRYWPKGDAVEVRRSTRKQIATMTNKRGIRYSLEDQAKIAAEKWQAVCEAHLPIEAFQK